MKKSKPKSPHRFVSWGATHTYRCRHCNAERKVDLYGGPQGGMVYLYRAASETKWSKEVPPCK